MKIENGKAVLEDGEKRFGNFFIKSTDGKVTFSDLNGSVSVSISKVELSGSFLSIAEEMGVAEDYLEAYVKVMYLALSVLPDPEYLLAVNKAANESIDRNMNLFGIRKDITPEEDSKIIESQKALHEEMEKLKEMTERESNE